MRAPAGLPLAAGWWEDLESRWSQPPRAYHSIDHLREVLGHWGEVDRAVLWADRLTSFAALCLHDAVYEPSAFDNEERSAQLVAPWSARFCPQVDVPWAERWIRLTARHGSLDPSTLDPQTALLLDCDMAILAATPERYRAYEAQVRQEYAHVPGLLFRLGRRRFLKKVLAGPIYHSEFWAERLEERAKANIREALGM